MRDGNLTVADLSRWFGRSYATVRGWVYGGDVGGAALDAAYIGGQLELLEKRLKKKQGLPVPRLSPQERIVHMDKLKNGASR